MERAVLGFNFPAERWPQARELFLKTGRPDLAEQPKAKWGYTLVFEEPADLQTFCQEAQALGFEVKPEDARRERIYSPEELSAAPLLALIFRTAEQGPGGPTYGTEYDLSNACPVCGTGAVQTSPLILEASEVPKSGKIFQTLDHEKLVSASVAEALSAAGLEGLELRRAQARDGSILPWWQLIAHWELPPMDPSSGGILRSEDEKPCPRCGRDGFYHSAKEPLEIRYSMPDADDLPDIAHTYEHFGVGKIEDPFSRSRLAQPLLIVKPIVLEVFEATSVRNADFAPVELSPSETA